MKISALKAGMIPLKPALTSDVKKDEARGTDQRARLKKATLEFESFFVMQMLKAMRSTIPESGLISGGLGKEVYTSLFDEELARKVAGSSPNSVAELLFRSLEKYATPTTKVGAVQQAALPRINPSRTALLQTPPKSSVPSARIGISRESKITSNIAPVKNDLIEPSHPKATAPRISQDPILTRFGQSIVEASRRFRVDPRLIYSVIAAESSGREKVVSPKGAKGLMQLTDTTAAAMGVSDSLNPHENIIGGTKYLRELLDRFDGDLRLALAAYNAGPTAVARHKGVPPYAETEAYVEKVLGSLYGHSEE